MSAHAYRTTRNPGRSEATRERIKSAVRELLAEGTFHTSTVEHVADRAGISRATLYQHFRSRVELVDAVCDTFAVNPALVELRQTVELPDPAAALAETLVEAVRFWASEDAILAELYGVVAIDPAARDLVARQRADRRGEMQRLAGNLRAAGALRAGMSEQRAFGLLMVLTSYETFREPRLDGCDEDAIVAELQHTAAALLLA
jgi:AcrR family transcriptional regulator